jgi:hypothetical protein
MTHIKENKYGFVGTIQRDLNDCYQIFWKHCNHNSRLIAIHGIPPMFFNKEYNHIPISNAEFNTYDRYS